METYCRYKNTDRLNTKEWKKMFSADTRQKQARMTKKI